MAKNDPALDADIFATEAAAAASPAALEAVTQIAEAMAEAEAEVDHLKAMLEKANKHLGDLKAKRVPEALAAVNQLGFIIADGPYAGVSVGIEDFVSGSLPKLDPKKPELDDHNQQRRDRAVKWLEENDGGELMKDTLTLTFSKSQHNEARDLVEHLRANGHEVDFKTDVHPQTLCAWARERLRDGEPLEPETLGLFVGRVAKLTWPKAPRRGRSK